MLMNILLAALALRCGYQKPVLRKGMNCHKL